MMDEDDDEGVARIIDVADANLRDLEYRIADAAMDAESVDDVQPALGVALTITRGGDDFADATERSLTLVRAAHRGLNGVRNATARQGGRKPSLAPSPAPGSEPAEETVTLPLVPDRPAVPGTQDEFLLELIAKCRAQRFAAMLAWAKDDEATACGRRTVPSSHQRGVGDVTSELLDSVDTLYQIITVDRPQTLRTVREMLALALDIMAMRAITPPDHRITQGPVLELVRLASESLAWLPGEILLHNEGA